MPHTCHATGCSQLVTPAMFMCKRHWFRLPKQTRDQIWATYRPGQEADWQPSREYLLTAREAVIWLAELEGKVPDTSIYDTFLASVD